MNLKIKRPVFIARMHHMRRVNKHKSVSVEEMDVIVYLPENRTYTEMQLQGIAYWDDHGKEASILFKGAKINMSDKNLFQLCKRLDKAKKNLVAYVRRLART